MDPLPTFDRHWFYVRKQLISILLIEWFSHDDDHQKNLLKQLFSDPLHSLPYFGFTSAKVYINK